MTVGRTTPGRILAGALPLAVLSASCMPWVMGQTAETLAPGQLQAGVGVAALAPPDQPLRPLPVPQAWAAVGVREGVDVALAYALPLTFHGRAKLRLPDGPWGATGVALGGGVHGFPDVAGAGERFWTPFLTADLIASARREGPRPYGTLRVIAPFYPRVLAATAWWVVQGGVELEAGALRWGPEAGVVVPALHPRRSQLVLGVSVRRASLP